MTSPTEITPTSCSPRNDRDLRDVPVTHLSHDIVNFVIERAGGRPRRHHLGDAHPAEPFTAVMDQAQYVTLAEDAD